MIDLSKIPLDDSKAFAVLNDGKFAGVFQFQGRALQGLCKQMEITCLDDLVAITALARPGPDSETWIKRRTGREEISYPHKLFEPILRDTLGVIVWQESVMRIGREIGDLSWEDTNAVRRGMGKSMGREYFAPFGEKWKKGAVVKGIEPETADRVWDAICEHGKYSFNKSHAVAYSIISYFCLWLKAHYPVEFAAATLDNEPDPDKQIALLRELANEGVSYTAVDPDHSTDRWSIANKGGKKILVGPLTAIRGIGPASVIEVLEARRTKQPLRPSLLKKIAEAKTEIDTLFPIAVTIKRLCPDLKAKSITSEPTPIAEAKSGDVMVIGVIKKITQINENEPDRVKKRGGREVFPAEALNIFLQDDSGELFCKVHARSFDPLGRSILEKAVAGKSIFALKGSMGPYDFKLLWVNNARYIGDMT